MLVLKNKKTGENIIFPTPVGNPINLDLNEIDTNIIKALEYFKKKFIEMSMIPKYRL